MGTSGAQRSPHTPAWARVNALYRDPSATPRTIASAIVAALDEPTRAAMAGAPVAACLGALLQAAEETADQGLPALLARYGAPPGPPALALAAAARAAAREAVLRGRQSSVFGHLALDATGTAALEAAAGPLGAEATDPFAADEPSVQAAFSRYATGRDLGELSGLFFGHDLGRALEHYVARDLPQHVGTPEVPDARAAALLSDRVGRHTRETARRLALGGVEDELWRALRLDGERRSRELQGLAGEALGQGLRLLEQGGVAP